MGGAVHVKAFDDMVELAFPVRRLRVLPEPQPVFGLIVQVQGHYFTRDQNQRTQPQVNVTALHPIRTAILLVVRKVMLPEMKRNDEYEGSLVCVS